METQKSKILILATLSGGYAGADSVGQLHTNYRGQCLRAAGRLSLHVPRRFLPAHF